MTHVGASASGRWHISANSMSAAALRPGRLRHVIGTPEQAQLFKDGIDALTLKAVRVELSRQFGDVYLALALWRGTGLEALCERLLPEIAIRELC